MPARDGSGPQGQGPRTGRGLGNCAPGKISPSSSFYPRGRTTSSGWGARMWDATFGRFFRRQRTNRRNQW